LNFRGTPPTSPTTTPVRPSSLWDSANQLNDQEVAEKLVKLSSDPEVKVPDRFSSAFPTIAELLLIKQKKKVETYAKSLRWSVRLVVPSRLGVLPWSRYSIYQSRRFTVYLAFYHCQGGDCREESKCEAVSGSHCSWRGGVEAKPCVTQDSVQRQLRKRRLRFNPPVRACLSQQKLILRVLRWVNTSSDFHVRLIFRYCKVAQSYSTRSRRKASPICRNKTCFRYRLTPGKWRNGCTLIHGSTRRWSENTWATGCTRKYWTTSPGKIQSDVAVLLL